jgi:hypothetical protein
MMIHEVFPKSAEKILISRKKTTTTTTTIKSYKKFGIAFLSSCLSRVETHMTHTHTSGNTHVLLVLNSIRREKIKERNRDVELMLFARQKRKVKKSWVIFPFFFGM